MAIRLFSRFLHARTQRASQTVPHFRQLFQNGPSGSKISKSDVVASLYATAIVGCGLYGAIARGKEAEKDCSEQGLRKFIHIGSRALIGGALHSIFAAGMIPTFPIVGPIRYLQGREQSKATENQPRMRTR